MAFTNKNGDAGKGPKLLPIFDPIKPPHFSVLIMACASVQVIEGDGLPPYICHKCISKLNIAFQFKTQCETSDAKLRQYYELQSIENATEMPTFIEIKKDDNEINQYHDDQMEVTSHTLQSDSDNTDANQVTAVQILHEPNQMEVVLKLQEPELETLQNVHLESTSSLSEDDKNELQEFKMGLTTEIDLKVEDISLITNNSDSKKPPKQHQCDTCGKVFKTKPGLVHHIRIHTGERPYICHLCDKRFINGGHLHTHMRTHTGEKNHVCGSCTKAFATAQQLTKHTIAIHTSERPYGCTYCPKRFASSSNLNTHIKIHTGEKNYHCDQCAKAFSTKGQLYQHMLVHTGEKAFLCEFCNKRFSQKAHLVRHLKMHKS